MGLLMPMPVLVRMVHICSRKQCPCKEPCAAHFKATAVVASTAGEGGENDPFQLEDLVQEGHVCVAVQLFLAGARAAGTFCASMKGKAGGCWKACCRCRQRRRQGQKNTKQGRERDRDGKKGFGHTLEIIVFSFKDRAKIYGNQSKNCPGKVREPS